MSNTYRPYSLGDTLPPPTINGVRNRAGQEVGVRVGNEAALSRLPGESVYKMCQRAAEQFGTERPCVRLYA